MIAQNPKKEFTISYDLAAVKKAVHDMINSEPDYYVLVKDDPVLNQIRIHQKGQFLDMGYHVDFDLRKISDTETNVVIEVSRNAGTINTPGEVSIANNSLKSITDKFSAFLSGNVNPQTGKANTPAPSGCMLIGIVLIGSLIMMLLSCTQTTKSAAASESDSKRDSLALIKEIEKEAQPAYLDAYKKVYRVKHNVELAEKGLLSEREVVAEFNATLGPEMGKLKTLKQVKTRIDTAGEGYIQYKFERAKAEVALNKAAEASYDDRTNK